MSKDVILLRADGTTQTFSGVHTIKTRDTSGVFNNNFPDTSDDTIAPEKALEGTVFHGTNGRKQKGIIPTYDRTFKGGVVLPPSSATLISKTISANGTYKASEDMADGYGQVFVQVPNIEPELTDITVTANGTYAAADEGYDGYGKVIVDVPTSAEPVLQEKTIDIIENGTTEITPDADYDGLSKVSVNVNVESAGGDLIEVDELPEIGEEGKTYKYFKDEFQDAMIGNGEDAIAYPIGLLASASDNTRTFEAHQVNELPDVGVPTQSDFSHMAWYYLTETDDGRFVFDPNLMLASDFSPYIYKVFETEPTESELAEWFSNNKIDIEPIKIDDVAVTAFSPLVVLDGGVVQIVQVNDAIQIIDGIFDYLCAHYWRLSSTATMSVELQSWFDLHTRPATKQIYVYVDFGFGAEWTNFGVWWAFVIENFEELLTFGGDLIGSDVASLSLYGDADKYYAYIFRRTYYATYDTENSVWHEYKENIYDTKTISENGTYDVSEYQSAQVDVYRGAVNVDALPTENIENVIYKYNGDLYKFVPSVIGKWRFNSTLTKMEKAGSTSNYFKVQMIESYNDEPYSTNQYYGMWMNKDETTLWRMGSSNVGGQIYNYSTNTFLMLGESGGTADIEFFSEVTSTGDFDAFHFYSWLSKNATPLTAEGGHWEKYSAGGGQDEGTISITLTSPLTTEFDVTGYAKVSATAKAQDKTVEITENGSIVVARDNGFAGMDNVYINANVPDNPLPVEIATEAAMNNLLNTKNSGAIYKYTGDTTTNYKKNGLYILELSIIPFTIYGTSYEAEFGMTWEDWVNSRYNVNGYVVRGGYIRDALNKYYVSIAEGSGTGVEKAEIIEINHTYGHTNEAQ